MDLPDLTAEQILGWADAHHGRTGQWPKKVSGIIAEAPEETWMGLHMALTHGSRGLPRGSSLPRLLAKHRGLRNPKALPSLNEARILAWADSHKERTGDWPKSDSGAVGDCPEESWANINNALVRGLRKLQGGFSLAQLLATRRDVRNIQDLPPLTKQQILAWADGHFERTGQWPKPIPQPIHEAPDETWSRVDRALSQGLRNLPGGSSLAQLLTAERGVRNPADLPPLTVDQILRWADSHFERTGQWPNGTLESVHDAPGETWAGIDSALQRGRRELPVRSTLAQLLDEHRGVRNRKGLPELTVAQILAWADAHHEHTGKWPDMKTGAIASQPGETWLAINHVLLRGSRGLSTSCSLADLLAEHRGVRNVRNPPKLTETQILAWATAHKERTGQWPKVLSGPIKEDPSEIWANINQSLVKGLRGLPGGSSLAKLIEEYSGSAAR